MRINNYYSMGVTIWKALLAAGAFAGLSFAPDLLPETWDKFAENWGFIIGTLLAAALVAGKNWLKNSPDVPDSLEWLKTIVKAVACLILCAAVAASTAGCNTVAGAGGSITSDYYNKTTTEETPDGIEKTTDETKYIAKSKAGLLGTVDATTHKMVQKWGDAENQNMNSIGQDAAGIDNSGNAQIFTAMAGMMTQFTNTLQALTAQIAPLYAPPAPAPVVEAAPE